MTKKIYPFLFLVNSAFAQKEGGSETALALDIPLWLFVLVALVQFLVIIFLVVAVKKRQTYEDDLLESKRILQNVLDTIPVRVFWKDSNSVFLGCNQLIADDAGEASTEAIIGKTDKDLAWKGDAEAYQKDDREVMGSGIAKLNYEESQTTLKGRQLWLKTSKIPLRNEKGEIYGVLGTCEDITDQKKVREELRGNERQLRSINENIPGVVYQFYARGDGEWGMHYVSKRSHDILGLDPSAEGYFERFIECVHKSDREAFIQSIKKSVVDESSWKFEGRFIRPDGNMVNFRAKSKPSKVGDELVFYGIILDITEAVQFEEQLHHSEKMKAVGQLAGGIAHDFNNMLGAIIAGAEVLEKYIKGTAKAEKFQKIIIESAEHAAELTKSLLRFSRKKPFRQKNLKFNDLLKEASLILKQTVDKRILVNVDCKASQDAIRGDSSQLQSALLNLGINSSHAMPEGGIINLVTRDFEVSRAYCRKSLFELQPGQYIELEIRDNGTGIEESDLAHIFEPFFTTKGRTQGTGLGLSAVYGTVRQHSGEITVSTCIDEGTSFRILLPLVEDEVDALPQKIADHKGSGKVLLVDDEKVMRLTAEALLRSFGYDVVMAENGQAALEIFAGNPDAFKVVVLDMMMPEMNGRDCFFEMRKINQNLPVILASGYTGIEDLKAMQEGGLNYFLQKPYDRDGLAKALSSV